MSFLHEVDRATGGPHNGFAVVQCAFQLSLPLVPSLIDHVTHVCRAVVRKAIASSREGAVMMISKTFRALGFSAGDI